MSRLLPHSEVRGARLCAFLFTVFTEHSVSVCRCKLSSMFNLRHSCQSSRFSPTRQSVSTRIRRHARFALPVEICPQYVGALRFARREATVLILCIVFVVHFHYATCTVLNHVSLYTLCVWDCLIVLLGVPIWKLSAFVDMKRFAMLQLLLKQ